LISLRISVKGGSGALGQEIQTVIDMKWPFVFETLALLTQSKNLIALYDGEERLRAANPAYCAAYHCDPSSMPFWHDVMLENFKQGRGPVIDTSDISAWFTTARARRASMAHREFEADLHDGRWILITETLSAEGWLLFQAMDITAIRKSSRKLRVELSDARRASRTDPLTGIPNRRYIMERVETWHETQVVQDPGASHAIAVIDLDNFKMINDKFGHEAGDEILIAFCRAVVNDVRPVDLFGRIGGEEFLLIMPNCSLAVADARLKRIQEKIRSHRGNKTKEAIPYTFSAGLTLVRQDKDIHHAIRRADKLLFQAKAAGRARVVGDALS
jgi:diguanylate cyclase (GGDEF)-like protein